MVEQCFICDSRLFQERIRVCSSVTPHTKVPCSEKIAEILGDEFVVIATSSDHICMACSTKLASVDVLENDINIIKNTLVSLIEKKNGILSYEPALNDKMLLMAEKSESYKRKMSNELAEVEDNPVDSKLKMFKKPVNQTSKKNVLYKCSFCKFQSQDLEPVRVHMRIHKGKKEDENVDQTFTGTIIPAKK